MLEAIVNFLNLKLELLNYFEKRHCLSVLVQNDKGLIYPAEYISEGNYNAIDFDAFDGVSYLRVNGEINVDRIDQKYTPKPRVDVTFPLRLIYAVRKDKLTADDAYSFDRVRASIAKQLESDSNDLTIQLNADKVQISTSGYVSDAKEVWDEETNETGQFQPKFDVVFGSMEVNVVVTTRVECIPAECDNFESDILRTFDFCKPSVFDRLTPTQVSCLEREICPPCADATVTNQAEDYSLSIASGATEKLPFGKVKNKEGNDVQVDYKPASDGYIFEETACPAGGSISVAVSDASPSLGEVITITATPSDFTPDSYLFFVYDNAGEIVFLAEQVSNIYNWTVSGIDAGSYTIYVLGVENGSPDITAFGTVDVTVSSNFLLDTVEGSGANFAFAFFRLRAAYSGFIANIRRSSDNAQKSFYFNSSNVLGLDSEDGAGTTLSSWIGSDDGYLVTGFSQDTAGVTFTASSAANQYKIINAGALININSVAVLEGTLKQYVISTTIPVQSYFMVAKNDGLNLINYIFSPASLGGFYTGGTFFSGIGVTDGTAYSSSVNDLNIHLSSMIRNDGVYVDGSFKIAAPFSTINATLLGGRNQSNLKFNGKLAAIITYNSDKSADRTAIESNLNSNFTPSIL